MCSAYHERYNLTGENSPSGAPTDFVLMCKKCVLFVTRVPVFSKPAISFFLELVLNQGAEYVCVCVCIVYVPSKNS